MSEKPKEKILLPRKPTECRPVLSPTEVHRKGKPPMYYDALPRDFEFAYPTPQFYATGFRILDVYKTEVDFSEYRNLVFLEDPKLADKWGNLRSRIPFPEGRITDLPGTRDLNYRNYCLRNMTSETARLWRKSIKKDVVRQNDKAKDVEKNNEPTIECVCDEQSES